LSWGALSGALNTITAEEATNDDGDVQVAADQVYFDAGDPNVALIKETPKIADDGKSITYAYSVPFSDWAYNFNDYPLPSHVLAQRALGIADPTEARDALVKAIQDKDNAALAKIATVWNTGFDITAMPTGDDAGLILSCGQYLITDFDKEHVTLKKNPDFTWGPATKIDEIIVRYNEDPMAQVQALQNGELDIIQPQVTQDVLSAVQGLSNVEVESGYEGTYEHVDLTFNNGGPFDPATYGGDAAKAKLVREAFLKVIPRQEIIDKLIKPLQPEAATRDSFNLVPGSPYYDDTIKENGSAAYKDVDIEGAKALLAQAGVTDLKVKFMYGLSNARRAQEFQLIHASAAQAGIELIDAGSDEWGVKLGDNTYDAVLFGWQNTSTSSSEPAANFTTTGQNNYGHYNNPKMDQLYAQLQAEFDEDKRAEINLEVEKILFQDAFGITIFQFPSVLAWNERVKNVSMTAIAGTSLWNFWEWDV
jgi:peptide/nickel transport system substrate-binding protein